MQNAWFHGGLQVQSRRPLAESFDCRISATGKREVSWSLDIPVNPEPSDYATVFFTVYSSNEEARRAWEARAGTSTCSFRVNRVTPLAFWQDGELPNGGVPPCPARLVEGSVTPGPITGFSSAQALMGNLIVRTLTLGGYVKNHADAEAAAVLLLDVQHAIAEMLQPQLDERGIPSPPPIDWPFSFVPCS